MPKSSKQFRQLKERQDKINENLAIGLEDLGYKISALTDVIEDKKFSKTENNLAKTISDLTDALVGKQLSETYRANAEKLERIEQNRALGKKEEREKKQKKETSYGEKAGGFFSQGEFIKGIAATLVGGISGEPGRQKEKLKQEETEKKEAEARSEKREQELRKDNERIEKLLTRLTVSVEHQEATAEDQKYDLRDTLDNISNKQTPVGMTSTGKVQKVEVVNFDQLNDKLQLLGQTINSGSNSILGGFVESLGSKLLSMFSKGGSIWTMLEGAFSSSLGVGLGSALAAVGVTALAWKMLEKALNDSQVGYDERRKKEQEDATRAARAETSFKGNAARQTVQQQALQASQLYGEQANTAEYADTQADSSAKTNKILAAAWREEADRRRTAVTPTKSQTETPSPEMAHAPTLIPGSIEEAEYWAKNHPDEESRTGWARAVEQRKADFAAADETPSAPIQVPGTSIDVVEKISPAVATEPIKNKPMTTPSKKKQNKKNSSPTVQENLQSYGPEFLRGINDLAQKYNLDPTDLLANMAAESGISPSIKNKTGGAVGLIQFMPSTAKDLGTSSEELSKMSAVEQLKYVDKYFKQVGLDKSAKEAKSKGKKVTASTLYSKVFLPLYADAPEDTVLGKKGSPELLKGTNFTLGKIYEQNSSLDVDHNDIIQKFELGSKIASKRGEVERAISAVATPPMLATTAPTSGSSIYSASRNAQQGPASPVIVNAPTTNNNTNISSNSGKPNTSKPVAGTIPRDKTHSSFMG